MPNDGAGLVVLDLDCARPFLAAVVCPSQIAGQDILWPLKPLKADYRSGPDLGDPALNASPGKLIGLIPSGGRLNSLDADFRFDADPRVRAVVRA